MVAPSKGLSWSRRLSYFSLAKTVSFDDESLLTSSWRSTGTSPAQ
jgi:hypothetical protein